MSIKYYYAVVSRTLSEEGWIGLFRKTLKFFIAHLPLGKETQFKIWIKKNEPDARQIEEQRSVKFGYEPRISLIVPSFNTPKELLIDMLSSVLNQTYPNWQLCIADGSAEPEAGKILESYLHKDKRIKIKFLPENKGVAGNSNEALSLATGDFVGVLNHCDALAPFALYEAVKLLNENRDIDLIYSDEDGITANGERNEPSFKPDWSPDYFLSSNYINHFWMIRKSLIEKAGGFRDGFNGAEEYDLLLRATEKTEKIAHITKILYHSRKPPSESIANKSDAEKRVISEALEKRGAKAKVLDTPYSGFYRVKYEITKPGKVSIIIPTKDKAVVLKKCVDSILQRTTYGDYEIIIVDNGSAEEKTFEYYESLKSNDRIHILKCDIPFNYSKINNYAIRQSDGDYILCLNNDTEVISPDWLEAMIEYAQLKATGAVGAKLLFPDETIQHAGVIIGIGGMSGHSHRFSPKDAVGYGGRIIAVQNLSAVTGACMMMRREVFEEAGGFDENFSVAFNDVELCIKIKKKGYRVVYTPYAELYHHECFTRGSEDTVEKQMRYKKEHELFLKKWGSAFEKGDPFYNPNLTLVKEDFSIKI